MLRKMPEQIAAADLAKHYAEKAEGVSESDFFVEFAKNSSGYSVNSSSETEQEAVLSFTQFNMELKKLEKTEITEIIKESINTTNETKHGTASDFKQEISLVNTLVIGDQLYTAWAGNSRAYKIHISEQGDVTIQSLTEDHQPNVGKKDHQLNVGKIDNLQVGTSKISSRGTSFILTCNHDFTRELNSLEIAKIIYANRDEPMHVILNQLNALHSHSENSNAILFKLTNANGYPVMCNVFNSPDLDISLRLSKNFNDNFKQTAEKNLKASITNTDADADLDSDPASNKNTRVTSTATTPTRPVAYYGGWISMSAQSHMQSRHPATTDKNIPMSKVVATNTEEYYKEIIDQSLQDVQNYFSEKDQTYLDHINNVMQEIPNSSKSSESDSNEYQLQEIENVFIPIYEKLLDKIDMDYAAFRDSLEQIKFELSYILASSQEYPKTMLCLFTLNLNNKEIELTDREKKEIYEQLADYPEFVKELQTAHAFAEARQILQKGQRSIIATNSKNEVVTKNKGENKSAKEQLIACREHYNHSFQLPETSAANENFFSSLFSKMSASKKEVKIETPAEKFQQRIKKLHLEKEDKKTLSNPPTNS